MSDPNDTRPTPPGLYDRQTKSGIHSVEIIAMVLAGLWLALTGWFFVFGGGSDAGNVQFLITLMIVFLPVALLWVAMTAARTSRIMREESNRLKVAIDAIRQAYVTQSKSGPQASIPPEVVRKLNEIASGQKHLETTLAMLISTGKVEKTQTNESDSEEDDQPTLSLGTPAEALRPPLSKEDFIRALHFPETAEDQEGFNALRRALQDHEVKQLVQAAQDILTLLSQDGIYMDDLRPDMARPEIWRAFGEGQRGRAVAPLGGVRDRSSLALAAGRMKKDPIFRDTAHHFLRRFDKAFAEFAEGASDTQLSMFAGTRTARAFMLLGRVAGTFD